MSGPRHIGLASSIFRALRAGCRIGIGCFLGQAEGLGGAFLRGGGASILEVDLYNHH